MYKNGYQSVNLDSTSAFSEIEKSNGKPLLCHADELANAVYLSFDYSDGAYIAKFVNASDKITVVTVTTAGAEITEQDFPTPEPQPEAPEVLYIDKAIDVSSEGTGTVTMWTTEELATLNSGKIVIFENVSCQGNTQQCQLIATGYNRWWFIAATLLDMCYLVELRAESDALSVELDQLNNTSSNTTKRRVLKNES